MLELTGNHPNIVALINHYFGQTVKKCPAGSHDVKIIYNPGEGSGQSLQLLLLSLVTFQNV